MSLQISRIQDDGSKFIVHGSKSLTEELSGILDNIGMGVSVSSSDSGKAEILYTENNRDLVLQILHDQVEGETS